MLAWLSGLGLIPFVLASGVAVIFMLPGSLFMTAAGAAFGLRLGFVAGLVASSIGAGLAFLVSRYAARKRVERWVQARPGFAAIDEAIATMGWKLVVLTRCCPIFPYIFQNYAYGLTRVRFSHYAVGSFLGLVPAAFLFAYLGSLGRAGAETLSGDASTLELSVKILGFLATVVLSVYITRVSRRALKRAGV